MTTKADIVAAIQVAADATNNGNLRISFGEPGEHAKNTIGESKPTGQAWEPEPKTWPVIIEGIASWADAAGLSGISDIREKLNELIEQYNQLLSDHNNNVVPSSASEVDPLP